MRVPLLLFTAATLGACQVAPPAQPPAPANSAGQVPDQGTPAAPVGIAPAGDVPATTPSLPVPPAQPAASGPVTVSGVVSAPPQYRSLDPLGTRAVLALGDDDEAPVAFTDVFVTDAEGNKLSAVGRTDAQGRFTLTLTIEIAGRPFVVNARVRNTDGDIVSLQALAVARGTGNAAGLTVQADIDFPSTVIARQALSDSSLTDFTEETYAKLVARLNELLTPNDVGAFDLTRTSDVLRELARIVKDDDALGQAFEAFGEGDPRDNLSNNNNNNSNPEFVPILSGQVM